MNGTWRAWSEMRTMSQCNSMVGPMPTPTPLTAATIGLGNDSRHRHEPLVAGLLALEHGRVGHLAQVLAGRERPAVAGDQHAPDVVVGRGALQGGGGRVPELLVEGVERPGRLNVRVRTPASSSTREDRLRRGVSDMGPMASTARTSPSPSS